MRHALFTYWVLLLCAALCPAHGHWHGELWGDGGGYWKLRVPIRVNNRTGTELKGYLLSVRIGNRAGEMPLVGQSCVSLRICNANGTEYLYEVVSSSPGNKLRTGDVLRFAVDLPAQGEDTYYVYAGNPRAFPTDLLHASLRNGSFDHGTSAPSDWTAGLTSAQHQALYSRSGGRNGSACVYHRVQQGASSSWVQWSQANILVTPGRRYVVRGWVRARNASGLVGFYVHVNGERPQMVNIVQSAGEGTYDWRRVEIPFEVPDGGQMATVGTVLFGTGEAWYDDVTMQSLNDETQKVGYIVLPVEKVSLKAVGKPSAWVGKWLVRAQVLVRHYGDKREQRLVAVTLPRAVHLVRQLAGKVRTPLRAVVVDCATGQQTATMWLGDSLYFNTALLPRAEHRFDVYLTEHPAGQENIGGYHRILRSATNLAQDGDFENPQRARALWLTSAEGGTRNFHAEVVTPGKFGQWAVRLHVPRESALDWVGWRQFNVRVKPSSRYIYAAWVKTESVTDGYVDIHGHYKASDNSMAKGAQFFGSVRRLAGSNNWTLCHSEIVTPADAHHVELHLTMNARGTVWHDGVLFCPVERGVVTSLEVSPTRMPPHPVSLWQVNPLVKVFPDDPPRQRASTLSIECARNEWEPLQLALWSKQTLREVVVRVSPPKHPSGYSLPVPRIYRVMTVPIDVPTHYYMSRLPPYCRHVPTGSPSTDGWAGEWPDPLIPFRAFDLPARRTQSVWLDCYVPENAPAGEYRSIVTLKAANKTLFQLPLRITVWGFALPKKSHLRVVYDLRSGPGWDIAAGENPEVLKRWYRIMAEHRVNPDVVIPMPEFRVQNGRVVMDASRFEPMARYCFNELGFNHCYTPWSFYALGWGYPLSSKFGFEPRTTEYENALREAYQQLVDYFTRNGWRDRLVFYLSDEPWLNEPKVVEDLRYFIELIKPVAPDVPIFSSTWYHSANLDGYLSMWGIGQSGIFPVEKMRERKQAGDRLLFTTDGQQAIDTPYLATERLLPLYCFVYDVEGYEFWGFSWWTHDPWKRGWHRYILQSGEGRDFYWIRYPNGDGYLAYPGESIGLAEPVGSIRLKAVREGAEDYEYYLLWQNAVERARNRGKDVSIADKLRRQLESLVPIPNAGGLRSTDIMPDPYAVFRLRREIASQIQLWSN